MVTLPCLHRFSEDLRNNLQQDLQWTSSSILVVIEQRMCQIRPKWTRAVPIVSLWKRRLCIGSGWRGRKQQGWRLAQPGVTAETRSPRWKPKLAHSTKCLSPFFPDPDSFVSTDCTISPHSAILTGLFQMP